MKTNPLRPPSLLRTRPRHSRSGGRRFLLLGGLLRLLLATGGLAATACSDSVAGGPGEAVPPLATGGTNSGSFDFATVRNALVEVHLRDEDGPVSGATVTMREATADGGAGDPLFSALSGPDGVARAFLVRPAAARAVELHVFHGSYKGPYTDPSLALVHGAFAPAVWLSLPELPSSPIELLLQRR